MSTPVTQSEAPTSDASPTLAKPLAPEDVRTGDFVAVLDWIWETPALQWSCCDDWADPAQVVRVRLLPSTEMLVPLRVESACLPFVLAVEPSGTVRTLDLRQLRIARLDRSFGKQAWKRLAPKPRGKRRKKQS